jgi:hypothetical protein
MDRLQRDRVKKTKTQERGDSSGCEPACGFGTFENNIRTPVIHLHTNFPVFIVEHMLIARCAEWDTQGPVESKA